MGAGGGGDPDLALTMALLAVGEHGAVPVVGVDDLDDEALVMPCGMLGAPTIADERVWSGGEGRTLRDMVERLHGRPVQALMPLQIAGADGVLPVTWAARLGLPLADADGRGRAFPELHQHAMHLGGVAAGPVVLTDGRGDTIVIHLDEESRADRLSRAAAGSLGGVCAAAVYCMAGARARSATIRGSVTRALAIGRTIVGAEADGRVAAVVAALGAKVIIQGTVVDVERDGGGLPRGAATVQSAGRDGRRRVRVELQNEYLLALEDGAPCADGAGSRLAPRGGHGRPGPRRAARLRAAGHRHRLARPGRLALGDRARARGPGAFGYDLDYTPMSDGAPGGDR